MAYKSNLEESLLGKFDVGKGKDIVKVKALKNGKLVESYDIRRYYKGDSGDYLPTKSGLRLNYEEMTELTDILIKNCDEDLLMQMEDQIRLRIYEEDVDGKTKKTEKTKTTYKVDNEDFEDMVKDLDNIEWE